MSDCDRCGRIRPTRYMPEYGANFCEPCAANPQAVSEDERGATINVWAEPTGYWSGSVVVGVPGLDPWKAYATSFHDISEAVDWARQQVDLAVAMPDA